MLRLRLAAMAVAPAIAMATTAPAGDGPSFDCAAAGTEVEALICEDARLAAFDRRLAERFEEALAVLGAVDAGGAAATADLRAVQRGWIGGRNDCWKAADVGPCVADAYLRREAELVALYMLEEPVSVDAWTCQGNPANGVTTYAFDTEQPALRIEYGDTIDAGVLVRAASGARYSASFGREFWMKGEEAMFTWDQSAGPMTCRRAPR